MAKISQHSAKTVAAKLKTAVRNSNINARQDSDSARSGRFAQVRSAPMPLAGSSKK